MIRLFLFLLLFTPMVVLGQGYAGLAIDNDLFFGKDHYYSSGVFLKYGTQKKGERGVKIIHWTLGQQIYTPIGRYDTITSNMDYPFSGYLFLSRGVTTAFSKKYFFRWNAEIGISGPNSLAKTFQNAYHELILNLPPLTWVAAQPAGIHFGVAAQFTHRHALGLKTNFTNQWRAKLGTHQTEGVLRSGVQWGALDPLVFYNEPFQSNTLGFGAHLGIELKYNLQDYNLSGSLFHDLAPFTLPSNRFRNTLEVGIAYRTTHWQLMVMAKAYSKDTPGQKHARHEVLQISILKRLQ